MKRIIEKFIKGKRKLYGAAGIVVFLLVLGIGANVNLNRQADADYTVALADTTAASDETADGSDGADSALAEDTGSAVADASANDADSFPEDASDVSSDESDDAGDLIEGPEIQEGVWPFVEDTTPDEETPEDFDAAVQRDVAETLNEFYAEHPVDPDSEYYASPADYDAPLVDLSGEALDQAQADEDASANQTDADDTNADTDTAAATDDAASSIAASEEQDLASYAALVSATALDSSYNTILSKGLTTAYGNFPAARNQNPFGTCWAFSSVGAFELSLINNGQADSSIDLSELQLIYFAKHKTADVTTSTGDTAGDANLSSTSRSYFTTGGNTSSAARVLECGMGLTEESTIPYVTYSDFNSAGSDNADYTLYYKGSLFATFDYDANGSTFTQNKCLTSDDAYGHNVARLLNCFEVNLEEQPQLAKQNIVDHGGVVVCYHSPHTGGTNATDKVSYQSKTYNGYTVSTLYNSTDTSINHAVVIVGWDDNFSKNNFVSAQDGTSTPKNNGAWLIRNSWNYAYSGQPAYYSYFWISYEDSSLTSTGYVYDAETNANSYDRLYQYDSAVYSWGQYSYTTVANVFTAQEPQSGYNSEVLDAVGMELQASNVNYKIEIYTDVPENGMPSDGELVSAATTTGTSTYAGYYSIPLSQSVRLTPGERFAIVVTADKTGALCVEYSYGKVVAHRDAGESYALTSSGWMDMGASDDLGNFVVKGLTNGSSVPYVEAPIVTFCSTSVDSSNAINFSLSWNTPSVSGGKSVSGYELQGYNPLTQSWTTMQNSTANSYSFVNGNPTEYSKLRIRAYANYNGSLLYSDYSDELTVPLTSYSISYVLNGGTNAAGAVTSYRVTDSAITLPTPTRDSYQFLGWYLEEDFSGEALTTVEPSWKRNITLYARWSQKTYTIKYQIYNSSPYSSTSTVYEVGKTYTFPDSGITRNGYTFGGWCDHSNGTGTVYPVGSSFKDFAAMGSTVTLYDYWIPYEYTVTFDKNAADAAGTMNPVTEKVGTSASLPANAFRRIGYVFTGWNTAADGSGTSYTDGQSVVNLTYEQNGCVTLYAQWTDENSDSIYYLNYDANGGTIMGASSCYTCVTGQEVTILTGDSDYIVRPGYKFIGWATEADGSGTTYPSGYRLSTGFSADHGEVVTLYAKWSAYSYSVYYYSINGGTTVNYVYSDTEPVYYPAYDSGYVNSMVNRHAVGWYYDVEETDANGQSVTIRHRGQPGEAADFVPTCNKEKFYVDVEFAYNHYSIHYEANGGSGRMSDTTGIIVGQQATLNSNCFTRSGYSFVSWNTKANGSGTSYTNSYYSYSDFQTMGDGAVVTLYAQWIPTSIKGLKQTGAKTTSISLGWDKITNADYSYIYRSTDNKNFNYVGFVNGSANTFTDSGSYSSLSAGKTYYYRVQTYVRSGIVYGTVKAATASKKPATVTGLKLSANSTGYITIAWSKASGASGYYIYRGTKSDGSDRKLVTTVTRASTLSYKDATGLSSGHTYYYWVRSYAGSTYKTPGSYSSALTTTTKPGKTASFTGKSSSRKTIVLSWKKVSGASGYYIYRSADNKTFTKVATVKGSVVSYTDKSGLSSGKNYYYRIYAYRTVSGKTYTGSYVASSGIKAK